MKSRGALSYITFLHHGFTSQVLEETESKNTTQTGSAVGKGRERISRLVQDKVFEVNLYS